MQNFYRAILALSFMFTASCTTDSGENSNPIETSGQADSAEPGDTTTESNICGTDCNGALVGAPNLLCSEYSPDLYESGSVTCTAECEVDVSDCDYLSSEAAEERDEFTLCNGPGTCGGVLECIGFRDASYCVRPCLGADDTDTCDENKCVEFASGSYCLPRDALRDSECAVNGKSCAEGDCYPIYSSKLFLPEMRCKLTCDPEGDGSECPVGESCIADAAGLGVIQMNDAGDPVTCNPNTDEPACDAGYSCFERYNDGHVCVKVNGLCGTSVASCFSAEWSEWYTWSDEYTNRCNHVDGHQYCTAIPDAEDGTRGAYSFCVEAVSADTVCFNFCGGWVNNSEELSCGEGAQCVRPAERINESLVDIPINSQGQFVSCATTSECEPYNSPNDRAYTCNFFYGLNARYCSRPMKMCVSDAEAAALAP